MRLDSSHDAATRRGLGHCSWNPAQTARCKSEPCTDSALQVRRAPMSLERTLAVARPHGRAPSHPRAHAPAHPRCPYTHPRAQPRVLPTDRIQIGQFFFPTNRPLLDFRRFVTVSGRVESVPGKKLTDRRRWPAVTQDEVLILTRDIMSVQSYQQK